LERKSVMQERERERAEAEASWSSLLMWQTPHHHHLPMGFILLFPGASRAHPDVCSVCPQSTQKKTQYEGGRDFVLKVGRCLLIDVTNRCNTGFER
jgi:hypothetical protein